MTKFWVSGYVLLRKLLSVKKSWFLKRSYPEWLIYQEMAKVKYSNSVLRVETENKAEGVSLIITYHLYLKNLISYH